MLCVMLKGHHISGMFSSRPMAHPSAFSGDLFLIAFSIVVDYEIYMNDNLASNILSQTKGFLKKVSFILFMQKKW